jgi:hypothetical protein
VDEHCPVDVLSTVPLGHDWEIGDVGGYTDAGYVEGAVVAVAVETHDDPSRVPPLGQEYE